MLRMTANAKINWTLDVLGTRGDGYHRMDMLLQSVSLADTLLIEEGSEITLIGSMLEPACIEKDLTLRAARLLAGETGTHKGARLTLTKRIPSGAGMGGGSADAAAALIGLNKLWGLDLPMETLLGLGLRLGADVPFMLTGGLCRVGGIGEVLTPIKHQRDYWLVITQPCEGLSTKEIFTAFDSYTPDQVTRPDNPACERALKTGDTPLLIASMGNALEQVSLERRPAIQSAKQALAASGACAAMMTGSGSAVYGVFESEAAAKSAQEQLLGRFSPVFTAKTVSEGILCEEI